MGSGCSTTELASQIFFWLLGTATWLSRYFENICFLFSYNQNWSSIKFLHLWADFFIALSKHFICHHYVRSCVLKSCRGHHYDGTQKKKTGEQGFGGGSARGEGTLEYRTPGGDIPHQGGGQEELLVWTRKGEGALTKICFKVVVLKCEPYRIGKKLNKKFAHSLTMTELDQRLYHPLIEPRDGPMFWAPRNKHVPTEDWAPNRLGSNRMLY